jgi:hypothetical protein
MTSANSTHVVMTSREKLDRKVLTMFQPEQIESLFRERVGDEPLIVLDKYCVSPIMYLLAAEDLRDIAPWLKPGSQYSAAELLRADHWPEAIPACCRALELCLKHIATIPESPIRVYFNGNFELESTCARRDY